MKEHPRYKGYYVSEDGRVFSNRRGTLIEKKLTLSKDKGYYRVSFTHDRIWKTRDVHRLIAETYLPDFEEHLQVNHIDRNRANNNVSNLEMVTPQQNTRHYHNLDMIKAFNETIPFAYSDALLLL